MESELDILLSCEYRTNASITSQKIPSNSNKHICDKHDGSKPSPQVIWFSHLNCGRTFKYLFSFWLIFCDNSAKKHHRGNFHVMF